MPRSRAAPAGILAPIVNSFFSPRGEQIATDSSTEFAAELTRFLRLPITLLIWAVLVGSLIGTPAFSVRRYSVLNATGLSTEAVTITGRTLFLPYRAPLIFFIDGEGRVVFPAPHY